MNPIFRFFIPVLVLGIAFPIATMVVLEPLAGDLSRIGYLPERAFGWNAPQSPVVGLPSNTTPDKAKIVIIGDSFSKSGRWQRAAFSENDSYVTLGFGAVCANIGPYMGKSGLAPDVVIIEAVERTFAERFFTRCTVSELTASSPTMTSPMLAQRDTSILYGSFGAQYALGGMTYLLWPGPQHRNGHSGGVNVRQVQDGCALFSHRDCGNALFLGEDELLPTLPLSDFDSPLIFYLKAAGVKKIIVVSVPNKTSVYLRSLDQARRSDIYLAEFARLNGVRVVPLHSLFSCLKSSVPDLYYGDDTHLSNGGMAILGAQIRNALRKVDGLDTVSKEAPCTL